MERVGYDMVPLKVRGSNLKINQGISQEINQDIKQDISKEKEQFCTYIALYRLNMFRLAKSILHNDSDAEDASSEAVLKAYHNLNTLKSFASFKPWIFKIVINEAYSIANRRKRMVYIEDLEVEDLKETVTKDLKDVSELWSVVNNLDEEFRTITLLFYYEDMSIKDISKTLEMPTGTVKSRLARARQKLKVLLANEGSS